MGKFNAEKHIENLKKTDKEMGKLKGLLEEYNKSITNGDENIIARVVLSSLVSGGWCFTNEGELVVISKDYGFIKWLVENKKIDLYKLPIRLEEYYQNTEAVGYITDDETILLMELAIQDEPIRFLCEILK